MDIVPFEITVEDDGAVYVNGDLCGLVTPEQYAIIAETELTQEDREFFRQWLAAAKDAR